ncbi:MAG: hypothetical protein ACXV5T_07915 [Halobacteriota archaeon]
MQNEVSRIFAQYLDFLPSDEVESLARKFIQRFGSLYSTPTREQVPNHKFGELEVFLFEEIRKVVRENPRLDLRYPDPAIENLTLLLTDRLEHVLVPHWNSPGSK